MSYFDTIRCHSCRTQIDPDSFGGRTGFSCPHCGEKLDVKDLLGVADAFVGIDDDEGNDLSLEDLMGATHEDQLGGGQASSRAAHAERQANPTGKPIGALELMKEMKKRS